MNLSLGSELSPCASLELSGRERDGRCERSRAPRSYSTALKRICRFSIAASLGSVFLSPLFHLFVLHKTQGEGVSRSVRSPVPSDLLMFPPSCLRISPDDVSVYSTSLHPSSFKESQPCCKISHVWLTLHCNPSLAQLGCEHVARRGAFLHPAATNKTKTPGFKKSRHPSGAQPIIPELNGGNCNNHVTFSCVFGSEHVMET